MIDTKQLNHHIENYKSYTKDYFTIDIDNLNWLSITLTYASLFSEFLCEKQYREELIYKRYFRVHHSSSNTGVHIKVNIKNNLVENIYYRAFFGDDKYRINSDLIRLNHITKNIPSYDIAFKTKIKSNVTNSKTFEFIDPLENLGMKKKTFYKLVLALKNNNYNRVTRIISHFKKSNQITLLESINQVNFTSDNEIQLFKIFKKYSDKNNKIKSPLAFSKAVTRYIKLNMR